MLNIILNANPTEPTDYLERKVVKGVIVNEQGKTLLLDSYLVGGGVEEGESYEQALRREAIEEAGIEIEILMPLGKVIGYRDALRKKYLTCGFLCKLTREVGGRTTTDEEELSFKITWISPEEAAAKLEKEIDELEKADKSLYTGDQYQSTLYNRQMSLAFLKGAFRK